MTDTSSCAAGTPAVLRGDLTIQVAADRKSELIALLDRFEPGSACMLDVSQIVDTDSAGIQLLIALRRSLADKGSGLELAGCRGSLRQALATYRLDERLDPVDLPTDLLADRIDSTRTAAGATS